MQIIPPICQVRDVFNVIGKYSYQLSHHSYNYRAVYTSSMQPTEYRLGAHYNLCKLCTKRDPHSAGVDRQRGCSKIKFEQILYGCLGQAMQPQNNTPVMNLIRNNNIMNLLENIFIIIRVGRSQCSTRPVLWRRMWDAAYLVVPTVPEAYSVTWRLAARSNGVSPLSPNR